MKFLIMTKHNPIIVTLILNFFHFQYFILQAQPIQPYQSNPWYWEYKGEPVMLIGGSDDDNLFQHPELKEHLDLMKSVGGNYIRNTMSSRDEEDVQAFKRIEEGKYDLEQWNEEYWQKFQNLLDWTAERNIFVQIEIWDKWDMAPDNWNESPWYPDNNVNYSWQDTKLKSEYKEFHLEANDFFFSVPGLNNDENVLRFQKMFVDKMLSYSLSYDHVLYAIDNELHGTFSPEWSLYWARYIQRKTLEKESSYWRQRL